MGDTVSSQLVMPKSRRWARAWLERPALVSKPAPQKSQRIRLKVPGSKLATVEREKTWTTWEGKGVNSPAPALPSPGAAYSRRVTHLVLFLTWIPPFPFADYVLACISSYVPPTPRSLLS